MLFKSNPEKLGLTSLQVFCISLRSTYLPARWQWEETALHPEGGAHDRLEWVGYSDPHKQEVTKQKPESQVGFLLHQPRGKLKYKYSSNLAVASIAPNSLKQ